MKHQMGRLAFRMEGQNWNCYFALENNMNDAVFLGSIPLRFVENQKRKDAFENLMWECFSDLAEDLFGARPVKLHRSPAPEHEKTKNA